MQLYKFELLKQWRRHRFILLFLLITAFVLGLFYRNVLMQDTVVTNMTNAFYPHYRESADIMASLNDHLKENPNDEVIKSLHDNAVKMNKSAKEMQFAILNKSWGTLPVVEDAFLQAVAYHIELGGQYHSFVANELEQRMKKNDLLLTNQWGYIDDTYPVSVTHFVKAAAIIAFTLTGIILLFLIVGDLFSVEWENATIRTLYTQPIQKWKIVISKYFVLMTIVIYAILVFFLMSVLVPLFFAEERGSFSYPLIVLHGNEFSLISIRNYLLQLTVLFLGVASFSISLLLLCSSVFKNRFATLLATTSILLVGYFITSHYEGAQTPFNPFYYFHFTEQSEYVKWNSASLGLLFTCSLLLLYASHLTQKWNSFWQKEKSTEQPFNKGNILKINHKLLAITIFEGRKLYRQAHVRNSFYLLIILILGYYFFLYSEKEEKQKEFFREINSTIQIYEENIIPDIKKEIAGMEGVIADFGSRKDSLSEVEKSQLQSVQALLPHNKEFYEYNNFIVSDSKKAIEAYHEKDWPTFYQYWINQNLLEKGELFPGLYSDNRVTEIGGISNFTIKASIEEKEYLASKHVEPVFSPAYVYTIHDRFLSPIEQLRWKEETMKVDTTGLFYIYSFFQSYYFLFPIVLLVFVFGMGYSMEKGRKRTLTVLTTQPISKYQLFLGKFNASLIVTIAITGCLILFMIGIGTLGNRFGDWNYPVLHYDTNQTVKADNYSGITSTEGGFHFIPMGDYLIKTILLFVSVIIFLLSLSIFCSLFSRNYMMTISITLIVTIGGYYGSSIPQLTNIMHLSPFTYLNVARIANGETAAVVNNGLIQTWMGLTVLIISIIFMIMLSMIRVRMMKLL